LAADPVKLKVSYKSPETLLGEFTRSVGKGGVAIESRRSLELGTRFVFELWAKGMKRPVEVLGEVVQCSPATKGKFLLRIRYDSTTDRTGLDEVLQKIHESHQFEKVRKHPRVPIMLHATEEAPYSPSYAIRDLSMGGMGLEVESDKVPRNVRVGEPFLCEIWLPTGSLILHGEIVWAFVPPIDRAKWVSPAFGVKFGKLRSDTEKHLERLLTLRGLPPPPWKSRVSFGLDAVSRMP
jgi:PilZ domain-containing protein